MKKVICFARVSTIVQDLQPQLDAVKRQIIADNYEESEIVVVKGKESAIKLKEEQRQTLNEMKQLIEENPTIEEVTDNPQLVNQLTKFIKGDYFDFKNIVINMCDDFYKVVD